MYNLYLATGNKTEVFRRTSLRGKEKVLIEIGLVALAHNLQKFTKSDKSV
ncbi:transposase [Haoranjiania flava]